MNFAVLYLSCLQRIWYFLHSSSFLTRKTKIPQARCIHNVCWMWQYLTRKEFAHFKKCLPYKRCDIFLKNHWKNPSLSFISIRKQDKGVKSFSPKPFPSSKCTFGSRKMDLSDLSFFIPAYMYEALHYKLDDLQFCLSYKVYLWHFSSIHLLWKFDIELCNNKLTAWSKS